jgi:hypothetical protein
MGLDIYVVIENGDPYPVAYMNYTAAVDAVKLKHKEAIEEELEWLNQNEGCGGCNEVDVHEAKEGLSRLYIEKGIHIEIHKLPVT